MRFFNTAGPVKIKKHYTESDNGHLVIFDPDAQKDWAEKIFSRKETYKNFNISVWGM